MLLPKKGKIIDIESPEFPVTFYVLKSDKENYNKCLDRIEKLYNEGKPIPATLFTEWTNYFYPKKEREVKQKLEQIRNAGKVIIDYFSANKHYYFQGVCKLGVEFRFHEMIFTILQSYFNNIWTREKNNDVPPQLKDDLIRFFYETIAYFTEDFNTKETVFISRYKKAVIAAFITHTLNYPVVNKKAPTPPDFFDASRNALKNIPEKSKAATK